jgi:Tfp pilus assembly protein PilP
MRLAPTLLALVMAVPAAAQGTGGAETVDQETIQQMLEQELGDDRYSSEGRRDPFISLDRPVESLGPRTRPRGMEGFLIQEVALKGIVSTPEGYVAMLLGPDNKSYFVRVGQRLYDGAITEMDGATVTLRQEVTDPLATQKTRDVVKTLYPSEEARQ